MSIILLDCKDLVNSFIFHNHEEFLNLVHRHHHFFSLSLLYRLNNFQIFIFILNFKLFTILTLLNLFQLLITLLNYLLLKNEFDPLIVNLINSYLFMILFVILLQSLISLIHPNYSKIAIYFYSYDFSILNHILIILFYLEILLLIFN
jgi:hypothetical protein